MEAKFKVGDKLVCVEATGREGIGWVLGKEIIVRKIETYSGDVGNIYWAVNDDGRGICERALELVSSKKFEFSLI